MPRVPAEGESIYTSPKRRAWPDYKVDPDTGCWEWIKAKTQHGYPQGHAHRRYWAAANGRPAPKGFHVHHVCRNRACVNPDHLDLRDPASHFQEHGREKRVLSDEEGAMVRELARDPAWSLGAIAERFGVSYMHVCDLAMGNRWAGDYKGGPPAKPERDCAWCGEPIPPTMRRHAKYCCANHRHAASLARRKEAA